MRLVALLALLAGDAGGAGDADGVLRARPGAEAAGAEPAEASLPAPETAAASEPEAVPDRWRVVESVGVRERWYDPYNPNTLKADRPIAGDDWFLDLSLLAETRVEPHRLARGAAASDVRQRLLGSLSLLRGGTAFRPPDLQLRVTPALAWRLDGGAEARGDGPLFLEELFADVRVATRSVRYDVDLLRLGVQPFSSDFRGLLFRDTALGARLHGSAAGNRFQWNAAWLRPAREASGGSGLSRALRFREEDVLLVNLYAQDLPSPGFTLLGVAAHDRSREGGGDLRVTYLGLGGEGHLGRLNLGATLYHASGSDARDPLAGRRVSVRAGLLALEASVDLDWARLRAYGLYASGDGDPRDGRASGFDAIDEGAVFGAGGASLFQTRDMTAGGHHVTRRDALLLAWRAEAAPARANFVNPGTVLAGAGIDLSLLPELDVAVHVLHLGFADAAVPRARHPAAGVGRSLGTELSVHAALRPLLVQNVLIELSASVVAPARGLRALLGVGPAPLYAGQLRLALAY